MTVTAFLQQIINGLVQGSIYILLSIGLSQIYGVLGISHFAHGSVVMLGAYVSYTISRLMGLPWLLAGLVALVFCALLGVLIESFIYKPVRNGPHINIFIVALGLMFIFENMCLMLWGADMVAIQIPSNVSIIFFGLSITNYRLYVIVTSLVLMGALAFLMKKTKLGRSIRAVSVNRDASEMVGVNVNGIFKILFAIGSALGGLCGLFLVTVSGVEPPSGGHMIVKAFAVMILGGLGSIPGVIIGGLAIGLLESIGGAIFGTAYNEAYGFIIIIFILIFKPTGLFGKTSTNKH